jgi:hypothetical protein
MPLHLFDVNTQFQGDAALTTITNSSLMMMMILVVI